MCKAEYQKEHAEGQRGDSKMLHLSERLYEHLPTARFMGEVPSARRARHKAMEGRVVGTCSQVAKGSPQRIIGTAPHAHSAFLANVLWHRGCSRYPMQMPMARTPSAEGTRECVSLVT